jgi:hypothetical protein
VPSNWLISYHGTRLLPQNNDTFPDKKTISFELAEDCYPPHLVFSNVFSNAENVFLTFENMFSLSQCLRSIYEYTRPQTWKSKWYSVWVFWTSSNDMTTWNDVWRHENNNFTRHQSGERFAKALCFKDVTPSANL